MTSLHPPSFQRNDFSTCIYTRDGRPTFRHFDGISTAVFSSRCDRPNDRATLQGYAHCVYYTFSYILTLIYLFSDCMNSCAVLVLLRFSLSQQSTGVECGTDTT